MFGRGWRKSWKFWPWKAFPLYGTCGDEKRVDHWPCSKKHFHSLLNVFMTTWVYSVLNCLVHGLMSMLVLSFLNTWAKSFQRKERSCEENFVSWCLTEKFSPHKKIPYLQCQCNQNTLQNCYNVRLLPGLPHMQRCMTSCMFTNSRGQQRCWCPMYFGVWADEFV